MSPLPTILLCALTGHLLARLHDTQAQAARSGALAHDLACAQAQTLKLRRELDTTRATLDLTHAAHNQALLQSRPKPAPKPGAGGFLGWDALGVAMPQREGFSFHDVLTFRPDVATPLDREAGA